jgi:hypothetical protein
MLTAIPLVLLAFAGLTLFSGCGQWAFADKVISVGERELTVAKGPTETAETLQVAPDVEVVLDGEPAALQDLQPGDFVQLTKESQGEQEIVVKIDASRPPGDQPVSEPSDPEESIEPSEGLTEEPALDEPAVPLEGDQEPTAKENEEAAEDEEEAADLDAADEEGHAAQPAEDAPAEEAPAEEILFTGAITYLDGDLIRVHGEVESDVLAEAMVFKLTDDTEITIAGEPGSKGDLTVGTIVTVTAERSGEEDVVAKRIDVRPTAA